MEKFLREWVSDGARIPNTPCRTCRAGGKRLLWSQQCSNTLKGVKQRDAERWQSAPELNPTMVSGQTDGEPGLVQAQAQSAPDALPQAVLLGHGLQREIRPDDDIHLD